MSSFLSAANQSGLESFKKIYSLLVNHPKDDGAGRYHSDLKDQGHGKKWTYCLVLSVDTLDKFTWMYNSLYKTTNILPERRFYLKL